jgi:ketosteroid isomerase-like protein
MSDRNVEIVRRAITPINERDVDAYLALCNSDIELINQIAAIEGPNKGEAGIRAFFDSIDEAATRFELEIERLQPLEGNRVLGSLMLHLETAGGFPQRPLTNLYELEDGRLSRVRVFSDRAEALAAAGLSD